MGKFNALINQYKLNDTIFLLAKCKHTIPDEAGIFDICRECVARKLWEEIADKVLIASIAIKTLEKVQFCKLQSVVAPVRAARP